ncbi:hypothetical protein ACQZL6_000748 [Campylobacter jejuni]|nr:hypothetical protein [Campylobacter jejuni]MCW1347822.1 hypothetical protein [Campylobacter jejuni]
MKKHSKHLKVALYLNFRFFKLKISSFLNRFYLLYLCYKDKISTH